MIIVLRKQPGGGVFLIFKAPDSGYDLIDCNGAGFYNNSHNGAMKSGVSKSTVMKTHIRPWAFDLGGYPETFRDNILEFCGKLLSVVYALESVMRQCHPPWLAEIQKALQPFDERLKSAGRVFEDAVARYGNDPITDRLYKAGQRTGRSIDYIMGIDSPRKASVDMLKAMHQHSRAQAGLYPLINVLKPVGRYFLETPVRERVDDYTRSDKDAADAGLFLDGDDGPCLYVPETYDGKTDWPLVVALHGGGGRGGDFIWFWLREARSRGFLLLAPSSLGRTWSFGDLTDAGEISGLINSIADRWRVDRSRMLLTGMSDGAIYTLTWGLDKKSPFSALAPISGVLHPTDLSFAHGKRIYLVHGLLDWMFPVSYARQAQAILKQAGADIVFHEIANLSHTYPREENAAILAWFGSSLFKPPGLVGRSVPDIGDQRSIGL